ncbi:MAG TPA: DUF72 domain-containing protein [Acidimicrobiales bacterium]|nr:DUF72 domain-containing protein [Acidimicrobiales bacterium]
MPVWIGTSGWQYKDWRGRFYPPKLPQVQWLEHYVRRFDTVEVNNTFYRLPKPETFASWRNRVPLSFVMTVKVNRFITHIKQLKDPEEPVRRFLDAAAPLGPRTGPMLIQLPPRLAVNPDRLRDTLDHFPRSLRLAVEFRHQSWFTDEVAAILCDRNAALVLTDRNERLLEPEWRTADWGYVRFHEGTEPPWPHYSEAALAEWAERIVRLWPDDGADVFAYFNNDPGCWAVADAVTFAGCLDRIGRSRTKVPTSDEVAPGAAA